MINKTAKHKKRDQLLELISIFIFQLIIHGQDKSDIRLCCYGNVGIELMEDRFVIIAVVLRHIARALLAESYAVAISFTADTVSRARGQRNALFSVFRNYCCRGAEAICLFSASRNYRDLLR